jgi:hypothetical protein
VGVQGQTNVTLTVIKIIKFTFTSHISNPDLNPEIQLQNFVRGLLYLECLVKVMRAVTLQILVDGVCYRRKEEGVIGGM